jgi:hypothetical protein
VRHRLVSLFGHLSIAVDAPWRATATTQPPHPHDDRSEP